MRGETTAITVELQRSTRHRIQLKDPIAEYMATIQDLAVQIETSFEAEQATEEEKKEHLDLISSLEHCYRVFLSQNERIRVREEESFPKIDQICTQGNVPANFIDRYEEIISGEPCSAEAENYVQYSDGRNYGWLMSERNLKKNERYQRFMNDIFHVHHPRENLTFGGGGGDDDDDDELIMGVSEIQIHCPIGKNVMVHPIVSRPCRHVFDKDNIMEMIRGAGSHRRVACPVAGCSKEISQMDLVEDRQTTLDIQREVKRRQEKASQIAEDAVMLDLEDDDDDE